MADVDVRPRSGDALLTSDPEVLGGRVVFRGTRVPVEILFDNLSDGLTVDEIVESYPSLRKDDVLAVLQLANERVKENAELKT
jgi:uncharacterized protein (DUF433 family)